MLIQGDCLLKLKELHSDSVDSVITDPPAGINFMGKAWDDDKGGRKQWCAWLESAMKECLRVLKPGGHALVWAIPRTSHWTATAIEDAGFEVRDVVTHLFGSGFPKSLNIEKATDGAVKGQGTALKPAAEFWILARKPLSEKTVAKNVLKHGTGGLNIDGSRIDIVGDRRSPAGADGKVHRTTGNSYSQATSGETFDLTKGRFPANLVLSGDAPEMLGEPSRFFYCAKVSPSERNAGLEDMPDVVAGIGDDRPSGQSMSRLDGRPARVVKNSHPTVKPLKLMTYLIKLITPEGGIVLDPFMGSGSTGVAAKTAGFKFIGIEEQQEYFEIATKRIEGALCSNISS